MLSELKFSENQDQDGDDLQFNDSAGKEIKSLEPDSKLSLEWRLSQKSSDRTPSGERYQARCVSENPNRHSNYARTQLIFPLKALQSKCSNGTPLFSNRSHNCEQNNVRQNLFEDEEFDILANRKIFKEKLIGISNTLQPRRARHMPKKEGCDVVLQKNFLLKPIDENLLLERLLIHSKPRTLSKMERQVLKIMVKRGIPEHYRKHLWLRASGAATSLSLPENKDYYKNLKRLDMFYPNSSFAQIELDLRRTFYEMKISQSEQLINKLRNVLQTYCKRNPTIGYCQGMNFLVGRLLKATITESKRSTSPVNANQRLSSAQTCGNIFGNETIQIPNIFNFKSQNSFSDINNNSQVFLQITQNQMQEDQIDERDEEEAFWIFTHLVESILPLDYYSNMVGTLIDQKIFYSIFQEKIPDLCQHLESVGFDPSLLAFQWLVCHLSYNLPQEVSDRIWDLFFLKGTKIIFRMSLALLYLMKNEIMKTTDFAEIFEILETFPRKFIDEKTLIQTAEMRKFSVRNRQIRRLRFQTRPKVEADLQRLVQTKDSFKGTYTKLKFLNKFYLYNGVQKSDNLNSTTNELYYKSLDQYENEVMRVFNCSPEWPICLFDFTYKNKIPSYIALRTSNEPPNIIENYFYPTQKQKINQDFNPFTNNYRNSNQVNYDPEFTLIQEKAGDGLLIERGQHYCEKYPKFIHNFKRMYEKGDMRLFNNPYLCFDIADEAKSHVNLLEFMRDVSEANLNQLDVQLLSDILNVSGFKSRLKSFVGQDESKQELSKSQIGDKNIVAIDDIKKPEGKFLGDQNQQIKQSHMNTNINVRRFQSTALPKSSSKVKEYNQDIDDDDDCEQQDHLNYTDNLQVSMNSLHQSALELIVGDTDQKKASRIREIFNKKLFTKYF